MYVQPGCGEPKHASHLLAQVRLQQPAALRWLRGEESLASQRFFSLC